MHNAAVELRNVCWLLDALLEFDVLVPERVALIVETDKVGTALE